VALAVRAMLQTGRKAPAFTLDADDGTRVSLRDFAGSTLVLYFYPRDDTPGCTREACAFSSALPQLQRLRGLQVAVVGVSRDTVASHQRFRAKYGLKFPLLSDPTTAMMQRYGVWKEKTLYGRKSLGVERTTVIIGPDGTVQRIFPKVRVDGHVDAVLAALKELQGTGTGEGR